MKKGIFGRESELDKQLKKTCAAHIAYDREKEKLKKIFYDKNQRKTVESFLKMVQEVGHYADQAAAEQFKEDYMAGNFDDNEIEWYKEAYSRYGQQHLQLLNEEEGE